MTLQFSEAKISIGTTVRISKDLVVTVPKDWHCEDLAIRSVSAGVQVSGLDAREMELDNVSGKCRFLDCTSEDFNAVTVSGTVAYQGTGSAIRFNTVSGSCTLEAASCPKQVELDGVSGNLTVVLPADCGYTADLDTLSGKMLLGERTYGKGTQVSGDGCLQYHSRYCVRGSQHSACRKISA